MLAERLNSSAPGSIVDAPILNGAPLIHQRDNPAATGTSAVGLPEQVLTPHGIAHTGWTDAQAIPPQHIA